MVAIVQLSRCGNPECSVLNTGICVEGNTPAESCPFFGRATGDDDDELKENFDELEGEEYDAEIPVTQQFIEPTRISLSSGEALTPTEVDQFLLWSQARFISIVGDFDSGKTTLICALYDKFLHGSFAGYLFGGSRTLVGLEKKSHHSRIDSGRVIPETLRTSLFDELKHFHLSLVPNEDLHTRIELMLSDRAGEKYRKARDNSDAVSELIEVKKSHYLVLLMDGDRIADPTHRQNAIQSVRQTLRAFFDNGIISKASRVQVVTTKVDLLTTLSEKDLLDAQLKMFRDGLQKTFGEHLAELSFWKIAARDPHGKFPLAYGVEELLKSWCAYIPATITRTPLEVALNTEFDRLLLRTPMEDIS
jgi:hypothetical protein